MNILLIHPGEIRYDYVTEHLGIASLKSYISSNGYSADTLDMAIEALSTSAAIHKIMHDNPQIVGISLLDETKERGLRLIRGLREKGYRGVIVVGGYFPTFADREILRDFPEIDYVIRGEGEATLKQLMDFLLTCTDFSEKDIPGLSFRRGGKIFQNVARPLIEDLDQLPPVDRKYASRILEKGSALRIYCTRGCWGQCTFCDIIGLYGSSPGKAWRRRSMIHLVDEIENLVRVYQTNHFIFNDDQFLVKGKKGYEFVEEFASELERRRLHITFELMCRADTVNRRIMQRLKSVGLQRVFLGIESFDEKQLHRFGKKISVRRNLKAVITLYREKIDVIASVILADAYTTIFDLLKQFIVLFELKQRFFNSTHCQISVNKKLEIYRGSAVYREYKEKGLLSKDDYLEGNDFKLRFWTRQRLNLFSLEEKLTRLIFYPKAVMKNLKAGVLEYFNNLRKSVLKIAN